jgi:5-methylthioadenosine/S-adenosylhomocysteine deaminase
VSDAIVVAADAAIVDGEARGPTAVLALGGAIALVGAPDQVAADPRAAGARRVDWSGRALIPGTVNAHNHGFQSLLRGIGDDQPFLVWRERALYRHGAHLGPEEMRTAALFAFGEMLLHGVTTVCDFYYVNRQGNENALATVAAARELGIRIVLARCFYDWEGAPAAFRESVPQAIRHFEELAQALRGDRLASAQPAPHSLHGASRAMIEAGAGCARDAGTPWHIHLAEEKYQVDEALERFAARPLHALAAMGVLDQRVIAVHGCWFDDRERRLLAERGAALAYCPASNMFLGDGVTDVVDLRQRGVPVALGTDGGCSNSRVSVLDEMRSAALLQKVWRTDGQAISAEQCFAMGTELGGRVLDLPVGRIAPGFRADLVALDLGDPSLWPTWALAKNAVYSLSARAITDVVVDGTIVVENRRLVRVDQQEIEARVRQTTSTWGGGGSGR